MKIIASLFIGIIFFPYFRVYGGHLNSEKKLLITKESTKENIAFAKYLAEKGVVKYSAYWCPNCLYQSELFGKQAYRELNVIECAKDGLRSQTKLCIEKGIEAFIWR